MKKKFLNLEVEMAKKLSDLKRENLNMKNEILKKMEPEKEVCCFW